jgi:AraC-like DNA-binding protein
MTQQRLFLRLDEDTTHGPESRVPAETLRALGVGVALRRHVAHILLYREAIPPGGEIVERVVPDGAVRLVFNFGDTPSVGRIAGHAFEAIGASTRPTVLSLRRQVEGLSVTLRPGAAAAVLGVPAGELAGTAVPLEDLWPGSGLDVLRRMAEPAGNAARMAALHAALQQRLQCAKTDLNPVAAQAVRLIAESGGRCAVREIAAAVGVGERRLQQLFHLHVGLSPRALSRLARLHHCLRLLRRPQRPAWADVAAESGFFDQSHLANEFRALVGLTPSEFFGHAASASSKTARG